MNYDVIVIGAGAAGLTAAMYTARKRLKTLVISLNVGGQTNLTSHIENYPGFASISGFELMQKFEEQALQFGAEMTKGKVTAVFKEQDGFKVALSDGAEHICKALIITSGKIPRTLNVPGEEKFFGKGVSTCATCDGPLFSGKTIAMVGGNTTAIEEALELANTAGKLYVVYSGEKLAAADEMVQKLKDHGNVEILLKSNVVEVKGDKLVAGVIIEDDSKNRKEIAVDGVFIELGYIVDTASVKDLVQLNEKHEIIVNDRCETSCKGVFAAGDVTVIPFKQTVISAGEGAKAGLEAYRYLSGGKAISLDWTH